MSRRSEPTRQLDGVLNIGTGLVTTNGQFIQHFGPLFFMEGIKELKEKNKI